MPQEMILAWKVYVPVTCHNGHNAVAEYHYDTSRDEFVYKGVPKEQDCECLKIKKGHGWTSSGSPYVLQEESPPGKCKVCAGRGKVWNHPHGGDMEPAGIVNCPYCKGTGNEKGLIPR